MNPFTRLQYALSAATNRRDDGAFETLADTLRRMAKARETPPKLRRAIRIALERAGTRP